MASFGRLKSLPESDLFSFVLKKIVEDVIFARKEIITKYSVYVCRGLHNFFIILLVIITLQQFRTCLEVFFLLMPPGLNLRCVSAKENTNFVKIRNFCEFMKMQVVFDRLDTNELNSI